jgi:hypothetical protein
MPEQHLQADTQENPMEDPEQEARLQAYRAYQMDLMRKQQEDQSTWLISIIG